MKIFILAQYFTVTMILTIMIGLFILKPVINQETVITEQVINNFPTNQAMFNNQ